MNISTRKKECPTASLLKYSLGGGIFIYMIKNGEFYLRGFFPGGIFSRAKGDFPGERPGDFFRGDFYWEIISGGIFTAYPLDHCLSIRVQVCSNRPITLNIGHS